MKTIMTVYTIFEFDTVTFDPKPTIQYRTTNQHEILHWLNEFSYLKENVSC